MLGHITYLSDNAMADKFGRDLHAGQINYGYEIEFAIESYLRYQGDKFAAYFDANTYLLMTKALDYFNPAHDSGGDLNLVFARARASFLVISFTTDWRFSPQRSREIVRPLLHNRLNVNYAEITSTHGHDSFLMQDPYYLDVMRTYLDKVARECGQ